ncbi:MAG TPA: DUF4252 domain-containing protein [Thermoanaerobaculia bacterium]|nr:DUF4252 domain-containing protein [Thermoanaerobaculia bacterium]
MRRILIAFLLIIPSAAWAQSGRIRVAIPDSLAATASESVDVTLDGAMLRFAARFLSDDADREVQDMVRKLDGIYVHSYEFDRDDAYDRSILAGVRAQLGPAWQRIVTVKSKTRENVEIYTMPNGKTIAGLVILAAEPRELTIVNIVGPVDLDKLASLEGQFGIPRVMKGDHHE